MYTVYDMIENDEQPTGGVDEEEHTKIGCVFLFGPKCVVCSP